MKKVSRHGRVEMTLRRLEQYSTLSPFCRLFYRAVYEWLEMPGIDADKLDQAFHLFLRCECQRHHSVGRIVRRGSLDLIEIIEVGRDAQRNLRRIVDAIEKLEPAGRQEAMIRELILAECAYHLGRTRSVILSLKRAIRLGCDHPLAHFALGYNLYHSALDRYAGANGKPGEFVLTHPAEFERACREAIQAFERGLGHSALDAQISWWMGLVHEAVGNRKGAYEAYTNAMTLDPENFGSIGHDKLQVLGQVQPTQRSLGERSRLAGLSPITDDDIARAQQYLADLTTFPSCFLDAEES